MRLESAAGQRLWLSVWQADSRSLESGDLAGSRVFCVCVCVVWKGWGGVGRRLQVAWGVLMLYLTIDFFFLHCAADQWHVTQRPSVLVCEWGMGAWKQDVNHSIIYHLLLLRVLRPPGGDSSISFGTDDNSTPRKDKMASNIFAEPVDPHAHRRNNPPSNSI